MLDPALNKMNNQQHDPSMLVSIPSKSSNIHLDLLKFQHSMFESNQLLLSHSYVQSLSLHEKIVLLEFHVIVFRLLNMGVVLHRIESSP